MFRKTIAGALENKSGFRFRGHEVRRIEAFSDAVFAFAVTLLIVSLEVPKNFSELLVTMRGFFAFSISFVLLMFIWYEQNIFFRRYGMDDLITIVLNCSLIFVVLFYVYPLKFLFTLVINQDVTAASNLVITDHDFPLLMVIYGAGYIIIYLHFLIMYLHALRKKNELALTSLEVFDTKTNIYKNIILVSIGILSILIAISPFPSAAGFSGFLYFLIGPSFAIFFKYRANKKRALQ